eukprot:gene15928-17529_t
METTNLTHASDEEDTGDPVEGKRKSLTLALPSSTEEQDVNNATSCEMDEFELARLKEASRRPLLCWFDDMNLKNEDDDKEKDETVKESTTGLIPEVRLSKLRNSAAKLARRGENEEAVNEKIKSLALVRIIYGDVHLQRARSYAELAEGYLKLRKLPLQAIKHAQIARDILLEIESSRLRDSSGVENKVETASVLELIYFTLGKANKLLKKYKTADNLLQKSYLVSRKKTEECGNSLRDVYKAVETLTLLGEVSRLRKQNGQAMEWFEKAIELIEEKMGGQSGELIPLYHQLGKTELQLGKQANFEKVYDSFGKARTIATTIHGKASLEYAASCVMLAKAYVVSDDRVYVSSAETAFEEAIMVYESNLGKDNQKTLDAQERLCKLLLQSGKQNEAEGRVKSLISGKVSRFGEISEEVADSYKTLGGLYLTRNQFKKAMTKLLKSQQIYQTVLGNQHAKTKSLTKVIESLKKSPAANEMDISDEKLKSRPRFNNTVSGTKQFGFSKSVMS